MDVWMEGQTQTDVCFFGKPFLILKEPAKYSPQSKSDPPPILEIKLYWKHSYVYWFKLCVRLTLQKS